MRETIRAYMEDQFLFEFGGDIADDTDLFKAGVIDSFGYIQMIDYLQAEFGIVFEDEDMLTNIMVSLDRIVETVTAKQAAANAA